MVKLNELCEIEVVYKRPVITSMEKVNHCEDMVGIFRELITEEKIDLKEFFVIALLSQNNQILGISKIGMGATSETTVNIKEILQLAIKTNSSGVIICHNHPSGHLEPSTYDLKLTKKIMNACELLDIVLHDHIIITSEGYHSLIADL
jgi:DNA repair protein RadC